MSDHRNDLILVEHRDGCHVVRFLSDALFDPLVISQIEQQIQEVIAEATPPRLVLALDTIQHAASSTLSAFISTRSACQGKGGDAVLASVPPSIMGILEVARLDGVFRIYETTAEAINSFSA